MHQAVEKSSPQQMTLISLHMRLAAPSVEQKRGSELEDKLLLEYPTAKLASRHHLSQSL